VMSTSESMDDMPLPGNSCDDAEKVDAEEVGTEINAKAKVVRILDSKGYYTLTSLHLVGDGQKQVAVMACPRHQLSGGRIIKSEMDDLGGEVCGFRRALICGNGESFGFVSGDYG
jgi:hypothetical protein